jgi:hypothetical protein
VVSGPNKHNFVILVYMLVIIGVLCPSRYSDHVDVAEYSTLACMC